jgi:hypothetical protein
VAALASPLAFVAWQNGDAALANVALDRALADNPYPAGAWHGPFWRASSPNGADDSFTVQDHGQGRERLCGTGRATI